MVNETTAAVAPIGGILIPIAVIIQLLLGFLAVMWIKKNHG